MDTFRDSLISVLWLVNAGVIVFLVGQSLLYLHQLWLAWHELERQKRSAPQSDPWWLLTSEVTMPISLLVPAYNEEATIVENIHSVLALHYPEYEVIVVNDGSKDQTLQRAIEALQLQPVERVFDMAVPHKNIRGLYASPRYPRLLLVDKENGGKSDALNAGINLSRYPLFCAVDADSLLDHDSLLRVVRPFIEEPEKMIAVGGRIRIVNGCEVRSGQVIKQGLPKQWLPLLQVIEYTRAFLMSRLAWSRLNAMLIISGAFGVFQRKAAIAVGGYSHNTVGEDMEIVVKLHRHFRENDIPYEMRYVPDPVCWTEAPSSLSIMRKQRSRWQRGMMQCLMKHRKMIFAPAYGRPGSLGLGYYLIFDFIGPVVEALGYLLIPLCWIAGILSLQFFLAYLALTFAFGIFISVASLLLEELALKQTTNPKDLFLLTGAAIMENFGFRQINNFWRLEGIWQYMRGQQGWGTMTRTGFQTANKRPEKK
jgi:cellulose synthase/poly-beta-1,6-N-acetylglucosamine synthase-like glycosyltransferase